MKVISLLLCGFLFAHLTLADSCQQQPLDILLTNDDGYQTPAIRALHRALAADGHKVKRIAPSRNFSGSSASITFGEVSATRVHEEELEVYAVTGSPGATVLLGATAIFPEGDLDLVISGINEGANLGPGTLMSGTVGATTVAAHALDKPIPAIAISTDLVNEPADTTENLNHYQEVSAFMVKLVRSLQLNACASGKGLLPEKTTLNINYPPLPKEALKGVKLARQGQENYFSLGFVKTDGDIYSTTFNKVELSADIRNSDTLLFNQGYITIVPLDGIVDARPGRTLNRLTKLGITD